MSHKKSPPQQHLQSQSLSELFGVHEAGAEATEALHSSGYSAPTDETSPMVKQISGYLDNKGEIFATYDEAMTSSYINRLADALHTEDIGQSRMEDILAKKAIRHSLLSLLQHLQSTGRLNEAEILFKRKEPE